MTDTAIKNTETPDPEATENVPVNDPRTADQLAAIEKLFSRIGEVSSLPTTAMKIINVTNDENAGASDLLSAIEGDPALATKVLRTVNTSYYAVRHQVADLKRAITLLGFQQVRNLALTVYVSRIFRTSGEYKYYSRERLWSHMVSVALTARLIAETCKCSSPDNAYTAGLLHDIGLILMDQHMPNQFHRILDRLDDDTPTIDVEREMFNFDHAELGMFVTKKWNFPESISAAAGFHHKALEYSGDESKIVGTVAVANYLCARSEVSSLGLDNLESPDKALYETIGLDADRMALVVDCLDSTLQQATYASQV